MVAERPVFEAREVTLRGPKAADVEARLRLGNPITVGRGYGVDSVHVPEMTRAAAERWFGTVSDEPTTWIIEYGGQMVGSARLWNIDVFDRHAEYGVGILNPALHGVGIGTTTTRLLVRHAFESLGLHRVWLRVLAENGRAVRCYTRCGFKVEGTEREVVWMDGEWHDRLLMGVLERELPPD